MKKLWKWLTDIAPEISFAGMANSVNAALNWLQKNSIPDLIIAELNLSDGKSLDVIKQTKLTTPVVFITPRDPYVANLFKAHQITYIPKPVKKNHLVEVVQQFKTGSVSPGMKYIPEIINKFQAPKTTYKKRFVVKLGEKINTIGVEKIAYFFTDKNRNYLFSIDGIQYQIDYHLDALELMLDRDLFFRINRQVILSARSISDIANFSKGRLKLKLTPPSEYETIVSAARVPDFKNWLSEKRSL